MFTKRAFAGVHVALAVGVLLIALVAPADAAVPASAPTIVSSKASYLRGEAAKFTVTIPKAAGQAKATGSVVLDVDGSPFGASATVTAGKATLTTNALPLGNHQIVADYSGGPGYGAGQSAAIMVTIAQGATATTAAIRATPVASGKAAVLSSLAKRVNPAAGGTLAGSTTFSASDGVNPPIVATVVAGSTGSSQWRPVLPDGRWSVTAAYSGNDDFAGSTSAPIDIVVGTVGGVACPVTRPTPGPLPEIPPFEASTAGTSTFVSASRDSDGYGVPILSYQYDTDNTTVQGTIVPGPPPSGFLYNLNGLDGTYYRARAVTEHGCGDWWYLLIFP